jgi:hypothetical protein
MDKKKHKQKKTKRNKTKQNKRHTGTQALTCIIGKANAKVERFYLLLKQIGLVEEQNHGRSCKPSTIANLGKQH